MEEFLKLIDEFDIENKNLTIYHLSWKQDLMLQIPLKYVKEAYEYFKSQDNWWYKRIAENYSMNEELLKIYEQDKKFLDCARMADNKADYESLENYLNLWVRNILSKHKDPISSYSSSDLKNIENNTIKGSNPHVKYYLIKNALYELNLKRLEIYNKREDNDFLKFEILAELYQEIGDVDKTKECLLKALKINTEKNDYYSASKIAFELGMKEEAKELFLKELNEEFEKKSTAVLEFDHLKKGIKLYGLENELERFKIIKIGTLIFGHKLEEALELSEEYGFSIDAKKIALELAENYESWNNYEKAQELCKKYGFNEKEIVIKALEQLESKEYYYEQAIRLRKKHGLDASKTYEKLVKKILDNNGKEKNFDIYEISKKLGFDKESKEFALNSLNIDTLTLQNRLTLYKELGMEEKSQTLEKLIKIIENK
ncbi:MAG: hypothetical protein PHN56_05830 [Candidatus Nanoarchaeia archaeon]|nr:hypothetical protein [Candidatus Nanoarchaeia archaeon]